MTTTTKKHVFRAPNGVELAIEPGTGDSYNAESLKKSMDAWYAKYGHILKANGLTVEQFLKEKREDVEKGLL